MTLQYYAAGYDQARKLFQTYASQLNGERGAWKIPSQRDQDLFVDYVYLNQSQSANTLFVMTSGIHGLEGYAGSAIQAMFLTEFAAKLDLSKCSFLLVHSMNPYGFKYHSRTTENHVNLNRNSSLSSDLFKTANPKSLELAERFIPKTPVNSETSEFARRINTKSGRTFLDDIDLDECVKAVGQGQYVTPLGLEFGGYEAEPQIRFLGDYVKPLIAKHRDIVLLDLHTGLGERGKLHLLTDETPRSVNKELFTELFNLSADKDIYEFTPSDAEGFYPTFGALNGLFPELAKEDQRVCALTMEFATMGHDIKAHLDGLNRWMLEHQGTHYGYANADLEARIKSAYLERFYPNTPEWNENVLRLSRELFTRMLTRANAV